MKIIKPSVEILDSKFTGIEILKRIENIGRVCYKSEGYITDTSYADFIKKIIKNEHLAVLEHFSLSVRIICDRGVTHEIVRHRLASYCLSKDTKIMRFGCKKDLTIEELYNIQENNYKFNGKIKLMLFRSVNNEKIIIPNKINKIIYTGINDIYEIKTKLGYKIKATKNHKFITNFGDKEVKDLKVGDKLFVNGIELYKDKNWLKENYHKNCLSLETLSKLANCSYSSIRKYIRLYKLTKILGAKPKDFKPWNKDLTENEDERIKKQAITLRKYHHNNGKGEKNSGWKGGVSNNTCYERKKDVKKCELCEAKNVKFEHHHIDKNRRNNDKANLLKICIKCHNLLHKNKTKKIIEDEIISIEYVGKDKTFDIEMFEPHHNFIANGILVHNCQESTRYVNYGNKEIEFIEPCFWKERNNVEILTNKVGKATDLTINDEKVYDLKNPGSNNKDDHKLVEWLLTLQQCEDAYKKLIDLGATPQEARSVLPNSLKTEIIMTANLREWRHILKLRTAKTAHPQMRQVMLLILRELNNNIPIIFEDIYNINKEEINGKEM